MNKDHRFSAFWVVTVFVLLGAVLVGLGAFRLGPPPAVQIVPALPAIGKQIAVNFHIIFQYQLTIRFNITF